MKTYESPGTLKRYRRIGWGFQRTFETSSAELPRFVDAIVGAIPGITGALVVIDQLVLGPRYKLIPLYAKYSIPQQWYGHEQAIESEGAGEVREVLEGVLSEWIDFLFVPTPRPFVMYADHHQYITFLAHRKGQLGRVVEALTAGGFREVEYMREF